VPEECHHEDDHGEEMCGLEEFIAKVSADSISRDPHIDRLSHRDLPDYTVRCKGKPGLENNCNNACPVE